jgi:hypothetical protein
MLPSDIFDSIGTPNCSSRITRLNTQPAFSPVNASDLLLPTVPHDLGPVWVANPSPYGSCIHYSLLVLQRYKSSSFIRQPSDNLLPENKLTLFPGGYPYGPQDDYEDQAGLEAFFAAI